MVLYVLYLLISSTLLLIIFVFYLYLQYFIWTSSIGYDVFYPGGAILNELVDSWIHGTVEFPENWANVCYNDIKKNEMHSEWWNAVELTNMYSKVKFPSAFWGGWYDIFLVGDLAAYDGYNNQADESVRFTSKLVVDPLGHCQSAAEFFPQDLIAGRTLLSFMQVQKNLVPHVNIQLVVIYLFILSYLCLL